MVLNLSAIGKKKLGGAGHGGPVRLVKNVIYDGYDYGILFTYFDGQQNIAKRDPFFGHYTASTSSKYHRYWRFSRQVIDDLGSELIAALCAAGAGAVFEDWETVSLALRNAKINVDPAAFTGDLIETIYPLNIGGVAVAGPYHSGVVALCKEMGGRYLAPMKAWKLVHATAAALKNNLMVELGLRDEQVVIADGVFSVDAVSEQDTPRPSISTFNNAEPEPASAGEDSDNLVYLAVAKPRGASSLSRVEVESLLHKYPLRPFQRVGVVHLATSTSAALFDDMGLGKSRQAVVAADIVASDDDDMILIACPASLIINWSREIAMICPDDVIVQQRFDPTARWIVTNYERLDVMIPHAARFKVMIVDEAHLLKEPSSLRTQYAFEIGAKVQSSLFILTGTPILNREAEIHTLLRLSGHPLGNTPLKEFESQFAGDPAFRSELNKRIEEWMLRRKKDLVLSELKGKSHQVVFVNPPADKRAEYDAVANDPTLLALPKIGRLRMLLESIKVESVMEMIAETGANDKFLIFCEFKETVAEFKRLFDAMGIGAVTLIGSHSITRRQKAVDQFQKDPDTRGFIGTTAAAGVGNTLTAANYVVFASLPWTPALKDQAEDRAYRLGQERLVTVKIPLLENTIDIDLWEMLRHKSAVATDVLDPDAAVEMEAAAQAMFAIAWAKRPGAAVAALPIAGPEAEQ
jgi:hypothetical protein